MQADEGTGKVVSLYERLKLGGQVMFQSTAPMLKTLFMVDALQYFEGLPKDEIKKIAFEIATQGTQGYRPDKKDYRISSLPGKLFSGYHILAYYYVSWMLAIPEMVSQLQLPYDDEYKLASSMHKTKK